MTEQTSDAASSRSTLQTVGAMPTRRKVLLGSAAALGIAGVAAFTVGRGDPYRRAAEKGGADAKPLGEGFYLVDGWVLTEADLNQR